MQNACPCGCRLSPDKNPVMVLLELCAKVGYKPLWEVATADGKPPQAQSTFVAKCDLGEQKIVGEPAASKKDAKIVAACQALRTLFKVVDGRAAASTCDFSHHGKKEYLLGDTTHLLKK